MDFGIDDVKLALAQWTAAEITWRDPDHFDEDEIDWTEASWDLRDEEKAYETAFGKLWVTHREGGSDQGSYAEIVFTVDNRRFFRKLGYYSSYDGYEWDGKFREVQAKQKVVTYYEDIEED